VKNNFPFMKESEITKIVEEDSSLDGQMVMLNELKI
jgi:hypothetical protein